MPHGKGLERCNRLGDGDAGELLQLLGAAKGVQARSLLLALEGAQHILGELVGAGGGQQHGNAVVVGLGPVLLQHVAGYGGVGVHQVSLALVNGADLLRRHDVVGVARPEGALQGLQPVGADGEAAGLRQLGHPGFHQLGVPVRAFIQQPLQIGGNEDVHAGGHGLEEGAVGVVGAVGEEIGEHVVAVAGADQAAHRQAHPLGVIAGQDVAEIAGGHHEVHGLPRADRPGVHQVGIGGEIIDHLGSQAAKVNRVGRGGELSQPLHLFLKGLVREELFDPALGIVKIAPNPQHMGVVPLGGGHLQGLNVADAAVGIKHGAAGAGHVSKALQSGLARIAAGGYQNADLPALVVFFGGQGDEVGQEL